jgi:hypothetical protein
MYTWGEYTKKLKSMLDLVNKQKGDILWLYRGYVQRLDIWILDYKLKKKHKCIFQEGLQGPTDYEK